MIEATLCFVCDGDEVLLIEKRRGLGNGWYNGPGGKLEAGETPVECAVREVSEEVGLEIPQSALEKAGLLTFTLDDEVHTQCHVFRTETYTGEPRESPEATPEWISIDDVPYDQMWDDDHLWLPHVLEGERVRGIFAFEGGPPLDEAAFVAYDLETGVDI